LLKATNFTSSHVQCVLLFAVLSGVISNSGGKVIVMKSAGQPIYKGSFANGIRSLSLPNWRESFSVSGRLYFWANTPTVHV